MEEVEVAKWVGGGVLFWSAAYMAARKALPERSLDFCSRLVSSAHATLAVSLATLCVRDWSCPLCPIASKSSPQQMKTLAITLSYMIYDFSLCLLNNHTNVSDYVHHAVSIVGIGAGLLYGRCGSEMVASLWITELSSPFLHMREFLKELGYRRTNLNLTIDILFAGIFSVARMGFGPYLTYTTCAAADNPLLIKGMALGLQLVSAFWFYKILRMVRYKLGSRSTDQHKEKSG